MAHNQVSIKIDIPGGDAKDNTHDTRELLDKAYSTCDKELLIQLIQQGVDLNLVDDYGIPLWDNIHGIYHCYINDPIASSIQTGEKTTKEKDVCGFLDLAINNGLKIERLYFERGEIPYRALLWLIYYSFSPTLLSYLVKKNIDMNIVNEGYYMYPTTLLDELDQESLFDQSERNEAGWLWIEWAFIYLKKHGAKEFDELYTDYAYEDDKKKIRQQKESKG